MARYRVIDGNTKDGRLTCQSQAKNVFIGERRNARGVMEEKTFKGKLADVNREWRAWQAEVKEASTITIKKAAPKPPKKEEPLATQRTEPKEVYVLAFVDAYEKRTDIGAYFDMDKAAAMVDALTVAAKATGMKGEYDLFRLEVRG